MRRYEPADFDWRIVFLTTFILALLLILTRTWQLAFLAGFVAGMLTIRAGRALVIGAAGVAFAWLGWISWILVATPAVAASGILVAILGLDPAMWWLVPVLTIVLGAVVGAVGAFVGYTGSKLFLWSSSASTGTAKD